MFTNDIYYGWQWMGQQWERSLFCQFQLLGSYWKVHWLKLAPGLKKVQWGKPTPPNIFFRPILPNFEKKIEIRDDDFGGWSMLPVRKTGILCPTLCCACAGLYYLYIVGRNTLYYNFRTCPKQAGVVTQVCRVIILTLHSFSTSQATKTTKSKLTSQNVCWINTYQWLW